MPTKTVTWCCRHENASWTSDYSRKYRIRNTNTIEKIGLGSIVEKMAESHLRWFWHVRRKLIEAPVKRVHQMEDSQTTGDRNQGKL